MSTPAIDNWLAQPRFALRPRGDGSRLSADEIKKLVTQLKGVVEILKYADPEDRRAVYRELNLAVVHHSRALGRSRQHPRSQRYLTIDQRDPASNTPGAATL